MRSFEYTQETVGLSRDGELEGVILKNWNSD